MATNEKKSGEEDKRRSSGQSFFDAIEKVKNRFEALFKFIAAIATIFYLTQVFYFGPDVVPECISSEKNGPEDRIKITFKSVYVIPDTILGFGFRVLDIRLVEMAGKEIYDREKQENSYSDDVKIFSNSLLFTIARKSRTLNCGKIQVDLERTIGKKLVTKEVIFNCVGSDSCR